MATRRKPAAKKIKFELTRSGVAGVGVVCFCIFLWMFLLGVWAGQTMLFQPVKGGKEVAAQNNKAPMHIAAEAKKKIVK